MTPNGNQSSNTVSRPAVRYFGSKWRLAPWICSHFPDHNNYIEPCGGSASVLLRKKEAPLEIYNDLDKSVVNFFRVLRDHPAELVSRLQLTPYARAEYEACRGNMVVDDDPIEWARRFFIVSWMSINCSAVSPTGFRSMTYYGQLNKHGIAVFRDAVDKLNEVARRLIYTQIENRPYSKVITRHDRPDTLIYFDPPYVLKTRASKKVYAYEWSNDEHRQAADLLRSCEGYVVVSGYACPLYKEIYEAYGWKRISKEAVTMAGSYKMESLWLSPRTEQALNGPVVQPTQMSFLGVAS